MFVLTVENSTLEVGFQGLNGAASDVLGDVGGVSGPQVFSLVPNQYIDVWVSMATRSLCTIVEGLAGVTEEILALKGRLCFEEIPLPTR